MGAARKCSWRKFKGRKAKAIPNQKSVKVDNTDFKYVAMFSVYREKAMFISLRRAEVIDESEKLKAQQILRCMVTYTVSSPLDVQMEWKTVGRITGEGANE